MAFFTFTQNNSGGFYTKPAKFVIIEAENPDEANSIAEDNGVYFNGCSNGNDCECCGDRWYRTEDYYAKDEPLIYGEKAELYKKTYDDGQPEIPLYIIIPLGK